MLCFLQIEKLIYKLQDLKNSTIVSDDNTFINFLKKENVNFIIPADFITLLKKLDKIDFIYLKIKKKLEDKNDINTTSKII